jgi:hypothetical protein
MSSEIFSRDATRLGAASERYGFTSDDHVAAVHIGAILDSADNYATHDPGVAWPEGSHEDPVDAIMATLDRERETRLDTASALGRAFSAARELRDFQVREREETDDEPFTIPRVDLSSDDTVAECSVSTYWGYTDHELATLVSIAAKYDGGLTVFRKDNGMQATLRFAPR